MLRTWPLALSTLLWVTGCDGQPAGDTDHSDDVADTDLGTTVLPEPPSLRATVGPEGGTLLGEAGSLLSGIALDIPPGALDAPTEVVLQLSVDDVPLQSTAQAIGPLVRIFPEHLALAVPATLTVPFDANTVAAAGETPEDCKVWQRDGDGWAQRAQVTSTEETVSVEISAFEPAAAGLTFTFTSPDRDALCATSPELCTVAGPCTDPSGFCITLLNPTGSPVLPAPLSSGGRLTRITGTDFAYVYAPSSGVVAPARVTVPLGKSAPTIRTWTGVSMTGTLRGLVAFDSADNPWLGISGLGSVRFAAAAPPTLFDTTTAAYTGPVLSSNGTLIRTRFVSSTTQVSALPNTGRIGVPSAGGVRLCSSLSSNCASIRYDFSLDECRTTTCAFFPFPSLVPRPGVPGEYLATTHFRNPDGTTGDKYGEPLVAGFDATRIGTSNAISLFRPGIPVNVPVGNTDNIAAMPATVIVSPEVFTDPSPNDTRVALAVNTVYTNDPTVSPMTGVTGDYIYTVAGLTSDFWRSVAISSCQVEGGSGPNFGTVNLGQVAMDGAGNAAAIDRAAARIFWCGADGGLQVIPLPPAASGLPADAIATDILYLPTPNIFVVVTRAGKMLRLQRAS
jgi:hypothetical protein